MDKCPLCGQKVSYRGLLTIECEGAQCENFKLSKELDKLKMEFDDVVIDWPWFCLFGRWLSARTRLITKVRRAPGRLLKLTVSGNPDLTFFVPCDYLVCSRRILWEWMNTSYPWKKVLDDTNNPSC